MITKATLRALKAIDLISKGNNRQIDIARQLKVSQQLLTPVLVKLKKGGIVKTIKGKYFVKNKPTYYRLFTLFSPKNNSQHKMFFSNKVIR